MSPESLAKFFEFASTKSGEVEEIAFSGK